MIFAQNDDLHIKIETQNSFFKYFPFERYKFFEDGNVRFSHPINFNDPFEAFRVFLTYTFGNQCKGIGSFNDNPFNWFGIFCMTDSPENLLMWSHYTNTHKGFCIEFDKNHVFFKDDIVEDNFTYCQQIQYSDKLIGVNDEEVEKLKKLNYSYKTNDKINYSDFPFRLYCTKSNDWAYENEWRLFKLLKNSNNTIVAAHNKTKNKEDFVDIWSNIYLYNIPFSAIKAVYIGANSAENFIEYLRQQSKSNPELRGIKVYKSMISQFTFKVIIIHETTL